MSIFPNSALKFPWFVYKVAHKPLWLSLVAVCISVIGFSLELYGMESAFPRSGSVLVCYAIFAVYLNHFVDQEAKHTRSVIRAVAKLGESPEEILYKMNPQLKGDAMRKQVAESMYWLSEAAKAEAPKLSKINNNIVMIEFVAGTVGTLIWGFGDLV